MQCKYDIVLQGGDKVNTLSQAEGVNGEWLILIHGFGGNSGMWKRQMNLFSRCYNVCAVTLPGHGDNKSMLDILNNTAYNSIAKGIINDFKGIGVSEVTLISVSMGTMIANEIFVIDKDFVKKSYLTGAVLGVNRFILFSAKLLSLLYNFLPFGFSIFVFASIIMPRGGHRKSRMYLIQECLKLRKDECKHWLCVFFNNIEHAKNIILDKSKIVLIVGDEDYVFIKGNIKSALKYNLSLHTIKSCGHVCSLHKWREFNALMEKLLAQPVTISAGV